MDSSPPAPATQTKASPLGLALRLLLPILILGIGWIAYQSLSEEVPAEEPPKPERAKLETRIVRVEAADYPVMLQTQGLIRATQTAAVSPQVTGRLDRFSDTFEVGAFVQKGDLLAEIDPVDFEAALAGAQASKARAEAALAQEEARARQARRNWEELDFDEKPSPLVLREPQLKEARANLDSALAELKQAELSLKRTKILAPFDAVVLDRTVGIGERVSPGNSLGSLAATDVAEVRMPLSPRQLAMLDSDAIAEQREVILTDALTPDLVSAQWRAKLIRAEGQVDETTREVFVIARIEDPFGLESGLPKLRIGQPVRAEFLARTLQQVVAIPRKALRNIDQVIEIADGKIHKQRIEPIWTTSDELIVRDLFAGGANLAISILPFAPEGAPISIIEEPAPAQASATPAAR